MVRFAIGTALTVAGVITALAIPGPLVPATEGVIFLILLVWAQWEFANRRKESAAYRQHVEDIRNLATTAKYTGLLMPVRRVGDVQITSPIDMKTPQAKDFRAHYPEVAKDIDGWSVIATRFQEAGARYQGLTHREAEKASTDRTSTGLPQLLSPLGEDTLDLGDVTWRVESGRLEASWMMDTFHQPVFLTIVSTGLSAAVVQQVWDVVTAFPNLPDVQDWRYRLQESRRLRVALIEGLGRAEVAVDLEGKCEHCPP